MTAPINSHANKNAAVATLTNLAISILFNGFGAVAALDRDSLVDLVSPPCSASKSDATVDALVEDLVREDIVFKLNRFLGY